MQQVAVGPLNAHRGHNLIGKSSHNRLIGLAHITLQKTPLLIGFYRKHPILALNEHPVRFKGTFHFFATPMHNEGAPVPHGVLVEMTSKLFQKKRIAYVFGIQIQKVQHQKKAG